MSIAAVIVHAPSLLYPSLFMVILLTLREQKGILSRNCVHPLYEGNDWFPKKSWYAKYFSTHICTHLFGWIPLPCFFLQLYIFSEPIVYGQWDGRVEVDKWFPIFSYSHILKSLMVPSKWILWPVSIGSGGTNAIFKSLPPIFLKECYPEWGQSFYLL